MHIPSNQDAQDLLPLGATITPVLIASDKTQLTNFSGDKTAYPVYLTIGNIAKGIRRQPSERATILLGYLPVPKLLCCSEKLRKIRNYEVFHECVGRLLRPLVQAGHDGTTVVCSDGKKRHIYPIVAGFIGDYPEQCLVACCMQNRCPKGLVGRDQRGDNAPCEPRDPVATLRTIHGAMAGNSAAIEQFELNGLNAIPNPFWKDLPHCDIFAAITPDILHQLHKGVFHSHLVSWCDSLMAKGELDRRFMSMATHPSLRHFSRGITHIKQWTGNEQKMMEKVFIGAISGAVEDERVITAARALLDFISLAQLHTHTDTILAQMTEALDAFHRKKAVFIENDVRTHFNIPKLHSLLHYVSSIRSIASLDGCDTELPERLHIDCTKKGYRASNKKGYTKQMVVWLARQESVDRFTRYLQWSHPEMNAVLLTDDGIFDLDSSIPPDADAREAIGDSTDSMTMLTPLRGAATAITHAKTPGLPNLSLAQVKQHFQSDSLLPAINHYLERVGALSSTPITWQPQNIPFIDAYKVIKLSIPSYGGMTEPFIDRIRATPASVAGVTTLSSLGAKATFDTVLLKSDTFRFRVARVRVIFKLPTELLHRFGSPPLLAFVELFTDINTVRSDPARQYRVSKKFLRDGSRDTAVVPITDIMRSCHLSPIWDMDLRTVHDNVLDSFDHFRLNDTLDPHSYLTL